MCNTIRVDPKGRLKIPVNLLDSLKRSDSEFYVTSEDGDSIRIYSKKVWDQVEERLGRLCLRDRNYQKILARAKYFGQAVALDNQGRVLIPMALRRSAQMKGTVDVLDYLGYLEVWNHARFLKSLKSDPITDRDEKALNEQLSSVVRLPGRVQVRKKYGDIRGSVRRFPIGRRRRRGLHSQDGGAIRESHNSVPQRARVA